MGSGVPWYSEGLLGNLGLGVCRAEVWWRGRGNGLRMLLLPSVSSPFAHTFPSCQRVEMGQGCGEERIPSSLQAPSF